MTESNKNSPAVPSVYAKDLAIDRLEAAISPYASIEPIAQTLEWLSSLLYAVDPDTGDTAMGRVVTAVFRKLDGDNDGVTLIEYWVKDGDGHHTRAEIEAMWSSLKLAGENSSPVVSTIKAADENDRGAAAIDDADEAQLSPGDTDTIDSAERPAGANKVIPNLLAKFSLLGKVGEIEKQAVNSMPFLGQLALTGQSSVWYSPPGAGKTLLTLAFLIEAIQQGKVNPATVFYFNMDDDSGGLLVKAGIAEEFRFHMIADGHQDFDANIFFTYILELIEKDQVAGVVIILDTLKKVMDLMDKTKATAATKVLRRFGQKGGTLVGLAHTNKHPGRNGKVQYGGVGDIVADFDCSYTLEAVSGKGDSTEKVVEFTKIKGRGNVVDQAAYSYSAGFGISYLETLLSVQPYDLAKLEPLKQAEAIISDAEVISAVEICIRTGTNTKMLLAAAVAKRTGHSKRAAIQTIERYTGDDPAVHRWKYKVRERGAKVFEMLDATLPLPDAKSSPAP
ncbi:MAG: AAA family ATPase [Sulfuritalea sp.]|nr:AAA family ATPase [Sulfuritalea sp.]